MTNGSNITNRCNVIIFVKLYISTVRDDDGNLLKLLFSRFSQTQLKRERTEERRKMFLLVNSKKRGNGDNDDDDDYTCMDTTLAKWRHIMPDSKPGTDVPNSVFEIAEKKLTGKTGKNCIYKRVGMLEVIWLRKICACFSN